MNHKVITSVISIVFFIGSLVLYTTLPKGVVDTSDATFLTINLTYPPETPITAVKDKAIELEAFIMKQPEVKYSILQQGNSEDNAKWGLVSSPTLAKFTLIMKTGANADHFIDQVNSQKSNYPGAEIEAVGAGSIGNKVSPVTIDLTGDNAEELTTAAATITTTIKAINGVTKVVSNQDEKKPGYSVVVDPALANPQETAMAMRSLLNPTPIGSMQLDGKDTPIFLGAMFNPATSADLSGIEIMTAKGVTALSSIAKIEATSDPSSFLHKDGRQYIRITAQVKADKLSDINKEIQTKTKDLKLPAGVTLVQGGASVNQTSDFNDLYMTMVVSIGIVLLIMVVTFKTFRAPIASILSLPFAAIGSVLAMMITQTPFEITSIFGVLMLIGIVVTNAIVLIDRVKQNEVKMSIREALLEAASNRMRPIMMTAIATICAMLPLLFSKAEQGSIVSKGLAVVVIGGLTSATLFTLIMVPTFYEALHFLKARRQRKQIASTVARPTALSN
ncbi:efflux RND transporter permease subunit [Cohnella sp. NL03-T5]|nr:efflux RND transporter permease subunit [Cohnella silvisoli]